uniref:Uncharacterized protein n=1 Tax=Fervidicoccus fontis TaxID=683846 RepID=A0A7J3ZMM6_9CREN
MKRNPRDEGLYALFKKTCSGRLPESFYEALIECEHIGATRIFVLDKKERFGLSFTTVMSELGLTGLKASRVKYAFEDEPWDAISELTRDCDSIRLVKGEGLVLSECIEPALEILHAVIEVCGYEDLLVKCFHEWE